MVHVSRRGRISLIPVVDELAISHVRTVVSFANVWWSLIVLEPHVEEVGDTIEDRM